MSNPSEVFNAELEPSFVRVGGSSAPPVFTRRPPAGAVADIATADATDLPSAIALANATKAKVNELLATLRSSGTIEP
jgi:hypothetical protein